MARTRERAKGRRGGEGERFAYLPESVLQSPALATAPHAAFRLLAVLLVGKAKERNGTLACSQSYAEKFGLSSHGTVMRSLALLKERGLVVVTRRVQKLKRHPTLYAVTWWPIYYRDGEALSAPEPATHAYREWQPINPTIGLKHSPQPKNHSTLPSGYINPAIGLVTSAHQPHLRPHSAIHQPHYGVNSKNLGGRSEDLSRKILKLVRTQPHLTDHEVAHILNADAMQVASARESQRESTS